MGQQNSVPRQEMHNFRSLVFHARVLVFVFPVPLPAYSCCCCCCWLWLWLWLWLLLLLAARASAAAWGGAISWLACAEARVLALCSPETELDFVFASLFAVFSSKKTPQPARCTVQKHAQLSISHRFFRCFPACRISHRFLQCFCRLSTFCTCRIMPASTCICLSALCVGGWGDGGRG